MSGIREFISIVLPWIGLALFLAVLYVRRRRRKAYGKEVNQQGAEGMALGMCFGVAMSSALHINIGIAMVIGMLLGLLIGSCAEKQ